MVLRPRLEPVIGDWYTHRDKGEAFQVVGIDPNSGTIEIQYFDGDLDEYDRDGWLQLPLDPAATPEDWTGPVDDVAPEEPEAPGTPETTLPDELR